MTKWTPDIIFVDAAMSSTYFLRRQVVIEEEPPVSQMKVRWPALFTEREISKEFTRLVSKDLSKSFFEGLDGNKPKDEDNSIARPAVPSDHEEDVIKDVVIGILVVVENVMEPIPSFYNDVVLVIEEEVVMRHLRDIPNAFLNLMSLVHALNLDYPKELKFTCEVIQHLFIGLGSDSDSIAL
ncbi:hypothetical protein IRJ41_003855 [Triplophysa rosa]|uniref:Uncharacterized protein n=1 Tax=Triplophysa rosa TaxID=992332 RepID=A0A9W7TFV6_TRIRA|nr:hypothetical protein IRJ41_003855 [Triplophysa rosa]